MLDRPDIPRPNDDVLEMYDRDLRRDWPTPEAVREEEPGPDGRVALVRYVRREAGTTNVLYSDLDRYGAAEVAGIVERNDGRASASGLRSYWKLHAHDRPVELRRVLVDRGYVSDNDPGDDGPVMYLDLGRPLMARSASEASGEAGSAVGADPGPRVQVRRVGPSRFGEVAEVERRIYGADFGWLRERLALHAQVDGFLSVYVAYVDGEAACAGWSYVHPQGRFVVLRGGGTVPEHRRKGLYAAVLAERLREALRRGVSYAVLEPSPMNVPIVRSFGFDLLTHADDMVRR